MRETCIQMMDAAAETLIFVSKPKLISKCDSMMISISILRLVFSHVFESLQKRLVVIRSRGDSLRAQW